MTTAVLAPLGRQLGWTASDTLVMARRNLLRYIRLPQLLFFATIQPVMFILLFTYVFGGAINVGDLDYIDFLLPGVFVQAVIFGSTQTGVGLADDLSRGMIDRFRSLPMSRSAVLAGRILADTVRNGFVVSLMVVVGTLVGFRFHDGALHALAAMGLALLLGMAFSWVSAFIGILVREVETAQVAGFVWIFPLTFVSSIFVPIQTMPGWLEAYAEISPITVTVDTLRGLVLGGPVLDTLWPSLAWIGGIMAVFFPLAVSRYRRLV